MGVLVTEDLRKPSQFERLKKKSEYALKIHLQTDAPDPSRLPRGDIVGVTVILLTCLYQDKVK